MRSGRSMGMHQNAVDLRMGFALEVNERRHGRFETSIRRREAGGGPGLGRG